MDKCPKRCNFRYALLPNHQRQYQQPMAITHAVFEKRLDIQLAALIKKATGKTIRPQIKTWANTSVLEFFLADPFTISKTITKGLPVEFFETVRSYSALTNDEWTEIIDLSPKSVSRYKIQNKVLPLQASERIIQILEITRIALRNFGTIENVRKWLLAPNRRFRKLGPVDLLNNSYGQECIKTELQNLLRA